MTRQTKTPRQRAEEALALSERKVKKLTAQVANHEKDLRTAKAELLAATVRRNYLAQDPALPKSPAQTVDDADITKETKTR